MFLEQNSVQQFGIYIQQYVPLYSIQSQLILLGTRRPAGGADVTIDLFLGLNFLTDFSLILKTILNNFPLINCNRTSFSSIPFDFSRFLAEFYFYLFYLEGSTETEWSIGFNTTNGFVLFKNLWFFQRCSFTFKSKSHLQFL